MQRALLTLTLFVACGSAHAASLCDDLHPAEVPRKHDIAYSVAPAPQMAMKSAPAAAQSPGFKRGIRHEIAMGGSAPAPAPQAATAANSAVAQFGIGGTVITTPENTEKYAHQDINPVQRTADNPVSNFSIDIDTGSYSNVRRMIEKENRLPPADAVRIEEITNYFAYHYPLPTDGKPFAVHTETVASPWKADRRPTSTPINARPPTSSSSLTPPARWMTPTNCRWCKKLSATSQKPCVRTTTSASSPTPALPKNCYRRPLAVKKPKSWTR